jgi:hypothetical protein
MVVSDRTHPRGRSPETHKIEDLVGPTAGSGVLHGVTRSSENTFLSQIEFRSIWKAGVSLPVSSDRALLLQDYGISNLQKVVPFNTCAVSAIWQEVEVKSRHLKLDLHNQQILVLHFQNFLWISHNFSITKSPSRWKYKKFYLILQSIKHSSSSYSSVCLCVIAWLSGEGELFNIWTTCEI